MSWAFSSVAATAGERAASRAGDDIIARPDVVMDRAFTVGAPPAAVWPWIAQLGKKRAGWYLPRKVERFLPRRGRAVRDIHPDWQHLAVGDVVPDYGGQNATFEVAAVKPPSALVYRSVRGRVGMTWSITLIPVPGSPAGDCTRVHLRLRLAPVRRPWLANTAGGFVDFLTIAGMAAGLKERVRRLRGPVDGGERARGGELDAEDVCAAARRRHELAAGRPDLLIGLAQNGTHGLHVRRVGQLGRLAVRVQVGVAEQQARAGTRSDIPEIHDVNGRLIIGKVGER
jgi:hypothetical protein